MGVMAVIGYLFLGYIILAIFIWLYKFIQAFFIITAFLAAIYFLFFTDHKDLGWLALVAGIVIAGSLEDESKDTCKDDCYEDDYKDEGFFSSRKKIKRNKNKNARYKKRKRAEKGGVNLTYLLMCLIPLFWPILILRVLCYDKRSKYSKKSYELDAYDYEQHLKSNSKN